MRILLSFDIDGTLETGDPPGPITLEMVIRARELGCIIGSSSDRSITSQRDMWARNNIEVDFVSNKHVLIEIKQRFEADYYLHMGDRELDRQFAREAEFEFMWMDEAAGEPWIAMKNGEVPQGASGGSDGPALETPPESFSTNRSGEVIPAIRMVCSRTSIAVARMLFRRRVPGHTLISRPRKMLRMTDIDGTSAAS